MGRTWDEYEYITQGYKLTELIKKGDFNNPYFYTTYNHPPLVKYLYGLTAHFDIKSYEKDGTPIFRYNYTYSRVFSALISSLSVVLITFIAWVVVESIFVAIGAGVILSMLPFFLGLSQLVTTESFVMLAFSGAFYCYFSLLQKYSLKKLLLTGVITGLALQVKQSNALLFLLYISMYFVNYKFERKKNKEIKFFDRKLFSILYIVLISFGVFILIWPTILFHFSEVQAINHTLWSVKFSPKPWQITLSPPEIFFGRLMLTPTFYYIVYFFITIPTFILVSFFAGVYRIKILKYKKYFYLLLWFLVPFIMSVYSWRQHGLRYIIEVYAPIAIISALGYEAIIKEIIRGRKKLHLLLIIPLALYLFIILYFAKPYYLDYFNILVGGTKGVYEKRSFQIGWWGQGISEAASYINSHAEKGSSIGLAVSPEHVTPRLPGLLVSSYNPVEKYDYVLVNYYHVIRDGFDDGQIKRNYHIVYEVKANGAVLAIVYKK